MIVKTAKVSAKGQLTLPAEVLRALNARKGTEFILVQEGNRIVLTKASQVGKRVLDETEGIAALGLTAFDAVWDNAQDEIWNDA